MTCETDKDFYCSAGADSRLVSDACTGILDCDISCSCRHRKFPTPEQFKEEYGFEWNGGVYYRYRHKDSLKVMWDFSWMSTYNRIYSEREDFVYDVVCACTPYGKPDDKWKPEVK